jgi:hypothetical protein
MVFPIHDLSQGRDMSSKKSVKVAPLLSER